ncbi:retrovirus-related Pol polyprotein from transposon 297 [Nephila pilipes]|uniref:Retrovirus-related Pol polyprotein from transposon 297 n=1 Tax=Nephila pilipes TaxID=299642 RepID=A0A8X6SZN6_NEPPI|nr:retrovirus-related Pol polyprotein from transposon 297 [Nephila pilipes]
MDFLREFNFTVDLERNEIRTGGDEIPLFSANIEFPKLFSVFAKEKTVIPARSECLIQGVTKASEHFRYAVTNSPSQISEKGVLVAATLVDFKKETIPVRILNIDNKPKTMDKGAIIASYEPVVNIVARPQEFSGEHQIQSILENLEGLNEDQRTAQQKLLQEFRNLFSTCDADVGHCNVTQHKINTGDHPPIK